MAAEALPPVRLRPEEIAAVKRIVVEHFGPDAEVRVFELGANDFLSKPFRARALIARIRAQLRQTALHGEAALSGASA